MKVWSLGKGNCQDTQRTFFVAFTPCDEEPVRALLRHRGPPAVNEYWSRPDRY